MYLIDLFFSSGFCKYIGPILEDYLPRDLLGEVFVGVQLDELLTNNSGIFGSRQVSRNLSGKYFFTDKICGLFLVVHGKLEIA